MKLIIGLGNYGTRYVFTRHNIGFMVVDLIATKMGVGFKNENRLKSEICRYKNEGEDYLLLKPQTYMNLSGEGLIAVMNFYKIGIEDIVVVYDDIDLELGRMRFRASGSAGGHNGVKSIIKVLGGDKFNRLKIGIGPKPNYMASEDYVLQNFSKDELTVVKTVIERSVEGINFMTKNGIENAQNSYN